ncbi:MAG: hypothetical protein ACI8PZ_006076 [Myxococcota bacterium]|jgi:hypothetical protein
MDDYLRLCRAAVTDPRAALTLREQHLRAAAVGVLALPGLAHRLSGSALVGPIALTALLDAATDAGLEAARHGDRVWFAGGADVVGPLLATLGAAIPAHLHPAAALGWGEVVVGPGLDLHGPEVEQVRTLIGLAREGEVLCTPAVANRLSPPDGVGTFAAPAPLTTAAGFPITVWRDYR